MVTSKSSVNELPATSLAAANRFIIGLPLLITFGFACCFLTFHEASEQQALSAQRQHNHSNITQPSSLPLITQPKLQALDVAPADPETSVTGSDNNGVGPAPANADARLQSTDHDLEPNANASLQATRKALKLDELNL